MFNINWKILRCLVWIDDTRTCPYYGVRRSWLLVKTYPPTSYGQLGRVPEQRMPLSRPRFGRTSVRHSIELVGTWNHLAIGAAYIVWTTAKDSVCLCHHKMLTRSALETLYRHVQHSIEREQRPEPVPVIVGTVMSPIMRLLVSNWFNVNFNINVSQTK